MIGSRFGPWTIDSELGRGGMGRVFLAHADALPNQAARLAAIKVLTGDVATDLEFQPRFQREIDVLRQLDHPGIVHFYESGVQDGHSWFAMEYVAGPNLEDVRQERGRLGWREVLDLALQIAPALKHAHDRGVIHRDLKPANLLLTAEPEPGAPTLGQLKLTDFGIASLYAGTHLTATGNVVGTAEYLSPEQAAGKPVTRRSDVYSLGVLLYTLLVGRPLFEGEPVELLHKHLYGQFDRPIRYVPDLPVELDSLIVQMLDKDPARRPADGLVLQRRLESLRLKMEHKARLATGATPIAPTLIVPHGGKVEGPATLMSRLMRAELERQNRGSAWQQLGRNPWVIAPLFLLTVSTIVWKFWPASDEQVFQQGARLMASSDPDDWYTGWHECLAKLDGDPHNPHAAEIDRFRQQFQAHQAVKEAARAARAVKPASEAQWFYQQGLRQRQQGNDEAAHVTWAALARAFRGVPGEAPWVKLAEERLAEGPLANPAVPRELRPVRAALAKARALRLEGKQAEADAIRKALAELYANDPGVKLLIGEE